MWGSSSTSGLAHLVFQLQSNYLIQFQSTSTSAPVPVYFILGPSPLGFLFCKDSSSLGFLFCKDSSSLLFPFCKDSSSLGFLSNAVVEGLGLTSFLFIAFIQSSRFALFGEFYKNEYQLSCFLRYSVCTTMSTATVYHSVFSGLLSHLLALFATRK